MRHAVLLVALLLAAALPARADFASRFFAEQRERNLRQLEEGKPLERVKAAESLGAAEAPRTIPVLSKALADADGAVRLAAANALWDLAQKNADAFQPAKPALLAALADADAGVAMHAAGALATLKVPAADLAPARKRVLAEGGGTPYVRFLAARGLIGIEPAPGLLAAMLPYLDQAALAARRSSAGRNNLQLARSAFERLADTQDRALIGLLEDELRRATAGSPVVLRALARFKPAPDRFTDTLLVAAGSQDPDTVSTAWDLLGFRDDAESLAKWVPRAAVLLGVGDRRDMALSALSRVAGKTPAGLPEIAALATNAGVSESQRARALEVLGDATDARGDKRSPEAARAAFALWMPLCDPVLSTAKPGTAFERCLRPVAFAWADRKAEARQVAKWLAANGDADAKIQFLRKLESLWGDAFDAEATARAELAHGDPRVKAAAESTLDRIRPAWREAGARAERAANPASAPTAPKAVAVPGKPGAEGAALYAAVAKGDVAQVKRLVNRANVAQPVRFPQMQATPPVPLVIAINHCGLPQVPPATLAEIVAYLISLGADPDMRDAQGDNLMDRAKYSCPPEVMKALAG